MSIVKVVLPVQAVLEPEQCLGGEAEEHDRVLEVLGALVSSSLVYSTDYAECIFDVHDGEITDASLKFVRVHRSLLCDDRWAGRPAAELPKPLQEVVGSPVKPQSPQGREDGVGAPSAARALQGGDRCDCGERSPCHSLECYHRWRGVMVRERLDISQHK